MSSLTTTELLRAARDRTGLDDFGEDYFVEPMRRMVDEFNRVPFNDRDAALAQEREIFLAALVERLQVHDYFRRFPEISEQPIVAPVAIVGRQRTGTSKMLGILASNPRWNTMPYWQATHIVPIEGASPDEPDPRIELGRVAAAKQNVQNGGANFHRFEAEEPEMEAPLIQSNFMTQAPYRLLPEHQEWGMSADFRPVFELLRKELQFIQWQNKTEPGRRWLLKMPPYLLMLPALADVFPDASMIMTHRHPKDSIASLLQGCELALQGSGRQVTRDEVRDAWLYNQIVAMQRYMEFRDGPQGHRFIDVSYSELVADSIAVAKRIYEFVNEPFTQDVEDRIVKWERDNPQHKAGSWKYTIEDYGLSVEDVERIFGDYVSRYRSMF